MLARCRASLRAASVQSEQGRVIVEPGTVIVGRYRLERPLASGGMGSVWVARHLQLQRDVAIKFMDAKASASPEMRARFEREARASAQMQHANIVQVHDFGLEGDTPYIVMELLRGESFEERLKREKRLSLKATAVLLTQVAKGLRRAHEAGFIHRDLKPSNLFIVQGDDDEIVKLLDFGIAKETGIPLDSSTKTGEFIGSPYYMSPEQIRDAKDIDLRSDLWSLGVILYRAVTGSLPFQGSTLGAVLADVFSAPIPLPSTLVADLPEAVDAFFMKALARDRNERFSSAREMAVAFSELAGMALSVSMSSSSRESLPSLTGVGSPRTPQAPPSSQPQRAPVPPHSPLPMHAPAPQHTPFPVPPPAHMQAQVHAPAGQPSTPQSWVPMQSPAMQSPASSYTPQPGQGHVPPARPSYPGGSISYPGGTSPGERGPVTLPQPPRPPTETGQPWNTPTRPGPGSLNPKIAAAIGGAVVVLGLVLFFVFRSGSSTTPSSDTPAPSASEVAAPPPTAAPSQSAAPEEGEGSETGVEVGTLAEGEAMPPEMQPVDAGPAAPAIPPIPLGMARLIVTAKKGTCKATINGVQHGVTPIHIFVQPGKTRVYCRMPTGSTKRQDVTVPPRRTTFVIFEAK